MQSKDYNALAAEMMGWVVSTLVDTAPEWHVFENKNGWIVQNHLQDDHLFVVDWNPLEDRNQAYQLLKRAEELGLLDNVIIRIRASFDSPLAFSCPSLWLTCPTDIITKACVDVWEKWRAENNA